MSNIIPTINPAGLGYQTFAPFPDVAPFTIRSGATYDSILETIRVWLRDELVPYLEDNSAAAIFQQNADDLTDSVNLALSQQSATVVAALNAAVQQVITAQIPVVDPLIVAILNLTSSATRKWLDARYAAGVQAPAPRGGGLDDTAALMAVIAPMHDLGATVYLQRGTYTCNLDLAAQFQQVTLIGAGMRATTLKAFTKDKAVVKFNGGSGSVGGGGIKNMALESAANTTFQGTALTFSGCTGVVAEGIRINGSFAEGIRFWNERPNDFTEFCTFEGEINLCRYPVLYTVANNVESFHGSGLVGSTEINMHPNAAGPAIQIDTPALPYNAPMSVTIFFTPNGDQWAIGYANANASRHCSFYGVMRFENHPTNGVLTRGNARVYLVGGIIFLGAGTTRMGNLFLARKVIYEGGEILAELLPVTFAAGLKNTPTLVAPGLLKPGEAAHIAVTVSGPNYHKSFNLRVYQSPYDATGGVFKGDTLFSIDSNNLGDPNFTWGDGGLYIANPNYTTAINVRGCVNPLGGELRGTNLGQ